MGIKVPPGSMQWRCGRCESWNSVEKGTCQKCGSLLQQVARAFRLENVLTNEERSFYEGTAIMILNELRSIRVALHELVTEMRRR